MTDKEKSEEPKDEANAEEATAESAEPDSVETAAASELAEALDERTRDLQRVTAEYHNYRKRVDRDRQAVADQATVNVVTVLLPILDDLDRAREHGDLVGPFGSVAEQLLNSLNKLGLEAFGEKGDKFDPMVHEAVAHMQSNDVTQPTCIDVMRRGYRLGDRLVRAAMVAVAEPSDDVPVTADGDAATEGSTEAEEPETADDEPTADDGQTADVSEATGEKSTGASTDDLDADVPDDEEALKGEVVEEAVAEASDAEAGEGSDDTASEEPESPKSATEEGDAAPDGADDDSDTKK